MQEMMRDPYAYFNFYNTANNLHGLADLFYNLLAIVVVCATVAVMITFMLSGNKKNPEVKREPEDEKTPSELLAYDQQFLKSLRIRIEPEGVQVDGHFRKILSGEIRAEEYRYLQLTRAGH